MPGLSSRLPKAFFVLSAAGWAVSLAAQSQSQLLPTAATTATVTAPSLTIFTAMDRSSEVVRSLNNGDSVYVDLRIDQGGMKWCGIRLTAQTNRLGFADCKGLVRTSAPVIAGASGKAGSALASGARSAGAEIPLARPATPSVSGFDAVKNEVIKEGVIDSGYIATAEAQARGDGARAALTRAALAHLAAGEFKLGQHEPDEATEHFEAMLPFAGNQRSLVLASILGRSYALLMKSEYASALELIEQGRKLAPQSADFAAMSGYVHYKLNQFDSAIADLQMAQRIQPRAKIAALLNLAERDREAEGDFDQRESSHFVVRYHGGASRRLASDVVHTLERQFEQLRDDVRYTPPEPITVILYTRQSFRDVTSVPDWAGALNDGRIRVAAEGIDSVPESLARSLKHELTHSFLFQKTQGRCPTWLQEGMAQWVAGVRVGAGAAQLLELHQGGKSLRTMEGSWMKLSSTESWFAYGWALAVVETIEAQFGPDGMNRLLEAQRTESSQEAALREGLRMNFGELESATVDYLKKTYMQ